MKSFTAKKVMSRAVSLVLLLAFLVVRAFGAPPVSAADPTTAQQKFEITVDNGMAASVQKFEITVNTGLDMATQQFIVDVIDPSSIILSVDESTINLSGVPGVLLADYLTANVLTGNPTGYALEVESAEPRLKCATSNDYIEPLAGAGTMVDNHWGWARDDSAVPTTAPDSLTWRGVTSLATTIKTFSSATDLNLGDSTRIWFGARADYSLPVCQYSATITITAIAK
jgi:hypothetical protein